MTPTARMTGVRKTYGSAVALEGLDLVLEPGRVYGLLGANGSGKTTSIRSLLGLLLPDAGEIELLGGPPDDARRARTGYLPEHRGLHHDRKVEHQLAWMAGLRGLGLRDARALAHQWIERLELDDLAQARFQDLSKGQAQKVQFAAAVMHEPELLILDEPFSGLDPLNQLLLRTVLRERVEQGACVLLSTHQLAEAEALIDHAVVLSRGVKLLDGPLPALRRQARRGLVQLRCEGDGAWIDGPEVLGHQATASGFEVRLAVGADSQALLRRALAASVHLEGFEEVEPTLADLVVDSLLAHGRKAEAEAVDTSVGP